MFLELRPPQQLNITEFIEKVLRKIILEVYKATVEPLRLIKFNQYIDSLEVGQVLRNGKRRPINTYEILYGALSNLDLEEHDHIYRLTINPNNYVPNLKIRMLTVAELVNYGTASIAPYPIIDYVFDKVADKMGDYYAQYVMSKAGE